MAGRVALPPIGAVAELLGSVSRQGNDGRCTGRVSPPVPRAVTRERVYVAVGRGPVGLALRDPA
jgi:hypothetical protein